MCGSIDHLFTNYANEGNQTYALFCNSTTLGDTIKVSLSGTILNFAEIRIFTDNRLQYTWERFGGADRGASSTTYPLNSTIGIGSKVSKAVS